MFIIEALVFGAQSALLSTKIMLSSMFIITLLPLNGISLYATSWIDVMKIKCKSIDSSRIYLFLYWYQHHTKALCSILSHGLLSVAMENTAKGQSLHLLVHFVGYGKDTLQHLLFPTITCSTSILIFSPC